MTTVPGKRISKRVFLFALALCLFAPILAQSREAAPAVTGVGAPTVAIGGEVTKPSHLEAAALQALPRAAFDASDHGNVSHWQGVALATLLQNAGAPLGAALRGKNLALYVRITAADGYRAVYSLAELDPAMHGDEVMLADRRDGHALDAKEGPFRIVAKNDKRPARWVRQVIAIDVLAAPTP